MKNRNHTFQRLLRFVIPGFVLLGLVSGCSGFPDRSTPLFDGESLNGWQGLIANPYQLRDMSDEERASQQVRADQLMRRHWSVADGILCFDGKGSHLVTRRDYGDFELQMEWQITPGGDSGVYLRGCPQVQIWDSLQNPIGSGGLFNNQNGGAQPLEVADLPPGEWNHFRIILRGDRVTVYLNDRLVVNDSILENYWRRGTPIPTRGPIELQSHGTPLKFRNIRILEF
jgi:hypothetical protein